MVYLHVCWQFKCFLHENNPNWYEIVPFAQRRSCGFFHLFFFCTSCQTFEIFAIENVDSENFGIWVGHKNDEVSKMCKQRMSSVSFCLTNTFLMELERSLWTWTHTWQTTTRSHVYLLDATFRFSHVVQFLYIFFFSAHSVDPTFIYFPFRSLPICLLCAMSVDSLIVCKRTHILHSQIGIIDWDYWAFTHSRYRMRWAQTDKIHDGLPISTATHVRCRKCLQRIITIFRFYREKKIFVFYYILMSAQSNCSRQMAEK